MNSRFATLLRQRTAWLLIALIAWVSVFGQGFWSLPNLQNLVVAVSVEGVMVMGMTIVMIGGGFDLSIGSVLALSGVIVVQALPMGKPVAILFAALAALAVGLANGMLITRLRVNPFIATLGTMVVVRGLVMSYTNAQPVPGTDPTFMSLGRGNIFGAFPIPGLIFAVAFMLTHVLLRFLKIGREIYALGGNEESARSSGIATDRIKILSYMICSFTAGISGIVLAARLNTGSPIIGENTALNVITAVLLGGASLSGGLGSALGSVGGLLCIGLLGNALNLFNVPAYYQRIAQGLLLLLLVALERIAHRRPSISTRAFAYRVPKIGKQPGSDKASSDRDSVRA
jgi:ribose transport system permease protein